MNLDTYKHKFFLAYIECALWSSLDDYGAPLDDSANMGDITPDSLEEMKRECDKFIDQNIDDLKTENPDSCGHDFWLTRNGHGTGFWDRGMGKKGTKLTIASESFGTSDLFWSDDKTLIIYSSTPKQPKTNT